MMAEGAYGKLGFARTYALIFGIVYIAVALVELIVGDLTAGDFVILQRTTLQNVIHWAVGVVVLGSFFAGEAAARMVARIVGIVFVAITIWGFVSPDSLGEFLGYSGDIPVIYNIVHLVTALVALFAGFAGRSTYRTAPAA
jgi:Domain of unknown function (DUF4383)